MKGSCNQQDCIGNEECMAKQDLVIAIDGSGSIKSGGFLVLKNFVKKLLARYNTEYWGDEAVKLAIVLFGNGIIMPDGKTVSPAILEQPLTFIKQDVIDKVDAMPFKKGFTNMAQAFAMAEDMFTKGSRKNAQQSVMLVTDGKPSFSFMTNEMVEQLDDKSIMRYFVIVSETPMDDETFKNMKSWASQPWETNIVHVEGLVLLNADAELWAMKAVTKFCPLAHSPMSEEYESEVYGYQHIKDGAYCGVYDKQNTLSKSADGAEQCAALAQGAGATGFLLGMGFRRGYCVKMNTAFEPAQYTEWGTMASKANPSCPDEEGWISSMLFDYYALEPVAAAE